MVLSQLLLELLLLEHAQRLVSRQLQLLLFPGLHGGFPLSVLLLGHLLFPVALTLNLRLPLSLFLRPLLEHQGLLLLLERQSRRLFVPLSLQQRVLLPLFLLSQKDLLLPFDRLQLLFAVGPLLAMFDLLDLAFRVNLFLQGLLLLLECLHLSLLLQRELRVLFLGKRVVTGAVGSVGFDLAAPIFFFLLTL